MSDRNEVFSVRLRNQFGLQPARDTRQKVEQELGVDAISHQLSRAGVQQLFAALDAEKNGKLPSVNRAG